MKYKCGSLAEADAILADEGKKHYWHDADRIFVFTGEDAPETPAPTEALIREVPAGGDQEIMKEQEWLKDRGEFGVLRLSDRGKYTLSEPIVFDAQRISVKGNHAKLISAGFKDPARLVTLTNTLSLADRFVGMTTYSNLHIIGKNTEANGNSRDGLDTGIYAHTDTVGASVRALMIGVTVQGCHKGIALGSRSYFTSGIGVESFRNKFGLYQEAGSQDFAENSAWFRCTFGNNDCHLRDDSGQRWKFYGTSFDFFGDPTGYRVTPDDMSLDLRAGAEFEMFGGHHEFHYGDHDGQTNSPFRLTGSNTKFAMWGGKIYNGGSQNPLWAHVFSTNNASQVVSLDGTQLYKLGRTGNALHDDALVGGSLANNNGVCAAVSLRNIRTVGVDKNDLPSVPAHTSGGQFLRNGVDDPYTELISRIACTGAAAVSKVSTENGVSPRNGIGSMIKITGKGKVLISFPVYEPMRRHTWAMFFNALTATGTVTIKERHSTVNQRWDGASSLLMAADPRNAYSGVTATLPTGANEWRRTSWKDVATNTILVPRMNCALFAIEIDTSGMTGGALYLDDVAFGLM